MKLKRHPANPILEKNPDNDWEAGSVFNPNVLYDNGIFRMVYRATNGKYVSSIGYAESTDGIRFKRFANPLIVPDQEYEIGLGCEDPRVTKINNQYFLYYTAVRGIGEEKEVRIALATSKDFKTWKKHGIILKNIKSGYIYSKKVKGEYLMFVGDSNIWIARSKNLKDWKLDEKPFLKPRKNYFDSKLVEVGPPFIELWDKLIMIYNSANNDLIYSPSFLVLDKYDPTKILYRHTKPLLVPEEQFELFGKVNNVIFAEGLVKFNKKYFLYYGGADKCVGLATSTQNEIEKALFL